MYPSNPSSRHTDLSLAGERITNDSSGLNLLATLLDQLQLLTLALDGSLSGLCRQENALRHQVDSVTCFGEGVLLALRRDACIRCIGSFDTAMHCKR